MTSRIGPYALLDELGRGGMGVVYAAQHVELGRRVALKLLLSEHAGPETTQRFRLEAQALAQVNHPNVVAIHEVGVDRGRPYLVMDLIEGESLQQRIKGEGPLEPEAAAALCETLARAMDHAHARGLLHRDLKPANVLLAADGRAVITDFGLARQLGDERERLTRTGQTLGTPAFMPPEQVDGIEVDARADVYALGATLYTALAGRPPFGGSTAINILTAVMTRTPEPLSKARPGLDRDLETVCLKCLEKAPEDRYATAGELADDLARWRQRESIHAVRRRLRRPGAWVAAGLVLLAAGVALAFSVSPNDSPSPPLPTETSVLRTATETPSPDLQNEGAKRWKLITELAEGAEKIRLARKWLRAHGAEHPLAEAARTWLYARTPRYTFPEREDAEAIFLGNSQAVTTGIRLTLWGLDAEPLTPTQRWRAGGRYLTAAGPNSFLLVQIAGREWTLWWTKLGSPRRKLRRLTDRPALAASPAGDLLALGQANQVLVLSLPSGKLRWTVETAGWAQGLAWRSVRSLITLSGAEGGYRRNVLELWELPATPTGKPQRQSARNLEFSSSSIAIDPASGRVVVANGSRLELYRVTGNEIERPSKPTFKGRETRKEDVLGSPAHGDPVAGVSLAGGRVYSVSQFELRVWDQETGKELLFRKRGPTAMTRVDATPQGRVLLSGPEGIELWDLSRLKRSPPRSPSPR